MVKVELQGGLKEQVSLVNQAIKKKKKLRTLINKLKPFKNHNTTMKAKNKNHLKN
jgi:hypothetical protein